MRSFLVVATFSLSINLLADLRDCSSKGIMALESKLNQGIQRFVETAFPNADKGLASIELNLADYLGMSANDIQDIYVHEPSELSAQFTSPYEAQPLSAADRRIIEHFRENRLKDVQWLTVVFKDGSIHSIAVDNGSPIHMMRDRDVKSVTRKHRAAIVAPLIQLIPFDDNGDEVILIGTRLLSGEYNRVQNIKEFISSLPGVMKLSNCRGVSEQEINGKWVCIYDSNATYRERSEAAATRSGEKTGRQNRVR